MWRKTCECPDKPVSQYYQHAEGRLLFLTLIDGKVCPACLAPCEEYYEFSQVSDPDDWSYKPTGGES